jgi:amino acid permease
MIKAKCGCFIEKRRGVPTIELVCDEHVGSRVYNNYDGKEEEIYDMLIRVSGY